MKTVNIQEAKTQLSKLVEEASQGEPFIIAKAGKPMVKVVPLTEPTGAKVRRLGFMAGQISVPDDFDDGAAEVKAHADAEHPGEQEDEAGQIFGPGTETDFKKFVDALDAVLVIRPDEGGGDDEVGDDHATRSAG